MKQFLMILLILLFVCSGFVFAQEEDEPSGPAMEYGIIAETSGISLDDETYTDISVQPYYSYAKFGLTMDIRLRLDEFGDWVPGVWDTWQSWVSRVYELRYGEKGEAFYLRFGKVKDILLGSGLLVKGYSNMVNYPAINKTGFGFDFKFKDQYINLGVETFADNVFDLDIFGARVYSNLPAPPPLGKLQVGITYVLDSDPYDPSPTADKPYNFQDGNDSTLQIHGLGVDVSYPFIEEETVNLKTYIDFATVFTKGFGFAGGIRGSFLVDFLYFPYVIELRYMGQKFFPAYFNEHYDNRRAQQFKVLDAISAGYGQYYVGFGVTLFNTIGGSLGFEESFTDYRILPKFEAALEIKYQTFAGKLTWTREEYEAVIDLITYELGKTSIIGEARWQITEKTYFLWDLKKTYKIDDYGHPEPIFNTTLSIQTKLQ